MRMFPLPFSLPLKRTLYHRSRFKIRVFRDQRVPITFRRRRLRIERTENRPYSLSPGSLGQPFGAWETARVRRYRRGAQADGVQVMRFVRAHRVCSKTVVSRRTSLA